MIYDSVKLIKEQLAKYIELNNGLEDEVVLGNIGMLEADGSELDEKVVVSLVNIEEERALKNSRALRRSQDGVEYKNPPVHLNLYLLFSANYSNGPTSYEKALQKLSLVIQFFQKKHVFTVQNASTESALDSVFDPEKNGIRVIVNMYTTTFEQLNHLWGSLGGKQVPSILYRCWLVQIQDEQILQTGSLIEQIRSSENIS